MIGLFTNRPSLDSKLRISSPTCHSSEGREGLEIELIIGHIFLLKLPQKSLQNRFRGLPAGGGGDMFEYREGRVLHQLYGDRSSCLGTLPGLSLCVSSSGSLSAPFIISFIVS